MAWSHLLEPYGHTALGEACFAVNIEIIKFLIERNANIELINVDTGENLLHWLV